MDSLTASGLGRYIVHGSDNNQILNFMGPQALRSVVSHIDLPNKRTLIFRGKHPPLFWTATTRARKSPLKKRNSPAAAWLALC
jgi:hypothetical protein